jgi:fumarate reductase iron-sulfur subunit
MQIKIQRDTKLESFKINNAITLLLALYEIKQTQDATLTFASGCKSGVCGACALRVNGKEQLACSYKIQDGDLIEPLNYHQRQRDLKVDKAKPKQTLKKAQTYLHSYTNAILSHQDELSLHKQSDCILCDSCFSACPVLAVNEGFLGPFALTRAYRYAKDKRESNPKEIIDAIVTNGIWDCTLCGECSAVCPKGIDPKMDITNLRNMAVQHGHMDPNFATSNFGTPDFGGGFGFDPNGGF